jgi:hypothetical protein
MMMLESGDSAARSSGRFCRRRVKGGGEHTGLAERCQEQTISELTPLLVLDRLQHKVEVHHVV